MPRPNPPDTDAWRTGSVTVGLTLLALIAFAANSVLCRLALGRELIDPISFSAIRLGGGYLVLALLVARRFGLSTWRCGNWSSATALAAYAIPFSLAYVTLPTGIGALVLFAAVQISMLVLALRAGERLRAVQWAGFVVASGGLVYLSWPAGPAAPEPLGLLLMFGAGVGWGFYSVLGRGSQDPLADTAGNFARAFPVGLAAWLVAWLVAGLVARSSVTTSPTGIALALLSGTLTSGVGYAIWYSALRRLATTTAAAVQLSVPVLAAIGGVLLLSEAITLRLVLSTMVILGGIALSLRRPGRASPETRR